MDLMIFHFFHADRLKCAQANMQSNFGGFNAALADASENFGSEMQSCRRRSDGASFTGKDGLVAFAVCGPVFPADVRRQRNVTELFDEAEEIGNSIEADGAFAVGPPVGDDSLQLVRRAEEETVTDSDFSSGAHKTLPFVGFSRKLASEQHFD